MADTMKMEYKIFLEAEDVSQSRILSCASYMKHVLESCNNLYISRAELDDESDLDDFVLRLFVEEEIEEIKKIVEPDVQVPKDMPQHSKDPYIASSPKSNPSKRTPIEAKEGNPKKAKEPSWLQRQSSQLWSRTKSGVKSGYEKIRESDVAAQAILLGASGARKRTAWC